MPVLISAGSDSDLPHLGGHLHRDRALVLRFNVVIGAATAIVSALLLFRRFAALWVSRRHQQHSFGTSPRTAPSTTSKPPPNFQSLPDRFWTRPEKGPGHLEEQASWAISRGEASGTAPVGLSGPVEGSGPGSSQMEEEEGRTTPSSGDSSRGVSTFLSPRTMHASSGLSYPGQVFPAAAAAADDDDCDEGGGHDVRISLVSHSLSPLGLAGGATGGSSNVKEKDNMDSDYYGRHAGPEAVVATSRSTTPFFGHPEDITDVTSGSVTAISGGTSWRRHFELNFTRSVPPPALAGENTVYVAQQISIEPRRLSTTTYAQSVPAGLDIVGAGSTRPVDGHGLEPEYTAAVTPPDPGTSGAKSIRSPSTNISTNRSYTKGHSIPPATAATHLPQELDGQAIDTSREARFSPSSYPPTSPLLPPLPPTTDHHFDLADIMFPGAGVVDGGTRVVPAGDVLHEHEHGEGGSVDLDLAARSEVPIGVGVVDDFAAGWKRHTRVYGGGVCLACAAAGGGGFYGARVRPEDRR